MEWLVWLESLPLSVWVRESGSLWSYPTVLFLHTVGLAFAVGMSAVISLRVLGAAAEMPLPPLAVFYGILWAGFWVNAVSGVALLIADATTKLTNPVFFIKMVAVVLAMTSMVLIRRGLDTVERPVPRQLKTLAWFSLVAWTGAILAGRLMAYVGPVSGVVVP
jgi:hypothetical protein